ncbi:hypothetical protein DFO67_1257 [Modicisalibacter xianhensis]|uniref:Uncharacterized protein n=1 Tax=Modicisalibacter xianhensis TaxID=442341 RepID=A0A4R8FCC4_9GAMM|nr:hypothetical protein [Halomonas xianhensis]TDX23309.1 hypothetical protein DFO67_1257 [Halomonas xianhensis]
MHTSNKPTHRSPINFKSKRNRYLFIKYINYLKIPHYINNALCSTPNELEKFINNYNISNPNRDALLDQANDFIYKNLIPLNEFNWLKENQRACNWAWLVLKTANNETIKFRSQPYDNNNIPPISYTSALLYDMIVSGPHPSSTPSRFKAIVEFFDGWDATLEIKYNLIGNLKISWSLISASPINLKWLDKEDTEQCEWAWNYINKNIPTYSVLQPITPKETYHFIYAYLDLWEAHPDTKKIFSLKIKKAWDQKNFRKKQLNKLPLNTYLEEETKIMLDSLAEQRGQKIHETLDWIIKKEFNNFR